MVFPFLRLPAELRNQIYEYVAYNDGKPFHIQKRAGYEKRRLSLQRASKQLRAEYSPIYSQCATVVIRWDDLGHFQYDFCRTTNAGNNLSNIIMHVSDFNTDVYYYSIFPLLVLRARENSPSITFIPEPEKNTEGFAEKESNLLNLIFRHDDPIWLKMLRKHKIDNIRTLAAFHVDDHHWVINLRGIKSDLTEQEITDMKLSVTGMRFRPVVLIQDWKVPNRNRTRDRKLEWVEL